jgi:hypothetical protein
MSATVPNINHSTLAEWEKGWHTIPGNVLIGRMRSRWSSGALDHTERRRTAHARRQLAFDGIARVHAASAVHTLRVSV